MAAQTSRTSALLFLIMLFGLIGVIGWFGWQWSQPAPSPDSNTSRKADSDPNTFNIDEQLDQL